MNNVVLTYNPYQRKNIILVDDKAFSPYSTVSNYLLSPFESWCEKIGESIADELNDDFSLTFVSDRTEGIILESYIRNRCPECVSFSFGDYENPIPVQVRCHLLSEALSRIGDGKTKDCEIGLYFDNQNLQNGFWGKATNPDGLRTDEGGNIFVEKYSDICSLKIKTVQDCSSAKGCGIYVFENEADATAFSRADCSSDSKIIIVISERMETVSVTPKHIVLKMTADDLIDNFFGFLEMLVVKPLIFSLAYKLKQTDPRVYEAVTTVDSIVLVDFDDSMECGDSMRIRAKIIPETQPVPELIIKSLNEKVIRVSGDLLVAEDSGEAVVEVYELGNVIPVLRKTVKVITVNRINKIEFDRNSYTFEEGGKGTLNATVYPANSENLHTIEWLSTDTKVATVSQDGTVRAIAPGVCSVVLKSENVSAKTEIIVKSKVADLITTSNLGSNIVSTVKQGIPYEVVAVPENSYDTTVTWKVLQDIDVIRYDGHSIETAHIGNAAIEFSSADGLIKKKVNIQVVSTLYKKSNPLKVITVILAFLTICMSLADANYGVLTGVVAVVVAFISAYVSKKNIDYEQSIVGYNKKSSFVSDVVLCVAAIALLIASISVVV